MGILRKAIFGTRDAPAVWQRLVRRLMLELGLEASRTSACVYAHRTRGLRVVAHVDVFLETGPRVELIELRHHLQKGYEVDGDILGKEPDEKSEGKALGRKIRVRDWGIQLEGDDKLVKSILEEFGSSGKEVDTPGLPKGETVELEEGQEPAAMDGPQPSKFRRGVAKLNYLAQDRGDMAYASKGVSKHMAKPCLRDKKMLTRAIEYLRKHPRWVCMYEWQSPTKGFTIYILTVIGAVVLVHAEVRQGGVALHGSHCILTWSKTQQLVALSSAEAELSASVKAAQEGLSLKHLAEELGNQVSLRLRGDSSANDGILKRSGTGKVKHLSVRQLWLQEKVGQGDLGTNIFQH